MKLLYSGASPFVRKVCVLMHETGQWDDIEQVQITAHPLGSEAALLAANPVGKIPALVRDDGCTLYDSRVICRFLDARKDAQMYPERRLWETLTLEATGDGMMEAAVLMVYEGRARPPELQSTAWVDAQWARVTRSLDALSSRWMSHLQGPLDMGQISIAVALGYLDLRHADRDWRQGHDALAAWYADFATRPSMQATVPVG